MIAASPAMTFVVSILSLLCGIAFGGYLARRGVAQQLNAVRDEALREREAERLRLQLASEAAATLMTASHENLVATIRQAGTEALEALERTHAETVRAHDEGASKLLASLREQLTEAESERSRAVEARAAAERELTTVKTQLVGALAQMAELRDQFQADRAAIEQRIQELVQAATSKALNDANAALAEQNAKQFIAQRAETMKSVEVATKPLTDGIQRLQQTVVEFDKAREAGAESLKATLETMARSDDTLRQTVERSTTETAKLSTALRDNRVRGRWGEIGLRNVLDKVGLTDFCDFVEQAGNEDGKRPDVVIKLPGDREVAVDSKVPFDAYMNALEATDPAEQHRFLLENANALRAKVRDLANKGYHRTPKAVGVTILYVQIESVVSTALSIDPMLVEDALDVGIVISSPATLLAYLRAFSREWSLYKQSLNAVEIVEQSHEMLKRLVTFAERFATVGARLDDSVKAWNASVGSFDARLVVTAKQIADLSGTAFSLTRPPQVIDASVRELQKVDELEAAAASISGGEIVTSEALPAA